MTETIILGGGCFWCLDAVFRPLRPVVSVECGYAAGFVPFPDYEQVCRGDTGHAEVVRVVWDAEQWMLENVLEVFFQIHDPTTIDRQGQDVGSQYRSLIVVDNADQLERVRAVLEDQQKYWGQPIVTSVVEGVPFYPAEAEHQDYFRRHPEQGYCRVVIAPKVAHMRQDYASLWQN